jgi:VWFA-related protein
MVLLACTALRAQVPSFSGGREAVRVDVLVIADGRPVRGLRAADFEVRDEGVLQEVELIAAEHVPIDAILVLDHSQSVSGDRLQDLRRAGDAVVEALTSHDSGAVVTFSHMVTLRQTLTTDPRLLQQALRGAEPAGKTALLDAIYAAMTLAESSPGRDLVMVFSDGVDTASWLAPERVLESARRSDATVYAVSTRDAGEVPVLEELAGLSGGRSLAIPSTSDLTSTFVAILEEFRRRYLLSYSPGGVSNDGWHRLQVRVKGRSVKVTARPGYQAERRP